MKVVSGCLRWMEGGDVWKSYKRKLGLDRLLLLRFLPLLLLSKSLEKLLISDVHCEVWQTSHLLSVGKRKRAIENHPMK